MKIKTLEQLDKVRRDCRRMVTKRAFVAGAASAVPFALAGVAADVGTLLTMLPKINRAFGLDPEQIDSLDEQARQQVLVLIGNVGSHLIGRTITKEVILSVLKTVGVRATTKTATSMVPVVGSAIGGALGFGMMKFVGNQHVDECYDVIRQLLEQGSSDDADLVAA